MWPFTSGRQPASSRIHQFFNASVTYVLLLTPLPAEGCASGFLWTPGRVFSFFPDRWSSMLPVSQVFRLRFSAVSRRPNGALPPLPDSTL